MCPVRRWRPTSVLGDIWNMVNTRATCTAHVSTPSGAWWLLAGCACWMSTPRYCWPAPSQPAQYLSGYSHRPQYFPIYFHATQYNPSITARATAHPEPLSQPPAPHSCSFPQFTHLSHLSAVLPFTPGFHVLEAQVHHSPPFLDTCPHPITPDVPGDILPALLFCRQ